MSDYYCKLCDKSIKVKSEKKNLNTQKNMFIITRKILDSIYLYVDVN